MSTNTLEGLLQLAGMTALFVVPIGVVLYWSAIRDLAVGVARRLGIPAPEQESPSGPPIERIAADARRIRVQLMNPPAGLPVARLDGWRRAYDDVLASGCRALELDDRLDFLPLGPERDAERERVEVMLERSGLRIRSAA